MAAAENDYEPELYFAIHDAEIILSQIKHNTLFRAKSTGEINKRDLERVKKLIEKIDSFINPQP